MRPFAWNLTMTGLLLSSLGWSGLWGEALLRADPIPLPLLAALFFVGLGLGAYDQRSKTGRRPGPSARNSCAAASLRAYQKEGLRPPRLTS